MVRIKEVNEVLLFTYEEDHRVLVIHELDYRQRHLHVRGRVPGEASWWWIAMVCYLYSLLLADLFLPVIMIVDACPGWAAARRCDVSSLLSQTKNMYL